MVPGPYPQSIFLLGKEMLPAVASLLPHSCPAAVLQLPGPTPKTAGRGCRRGRGPAQLLALLGLGEGYDMKEPRRPGLWRKLPPTPPPTLARWLCTSGPQEPPLPAPRSVEWWGKGCHP